MKSSLLALGVIGFIGIASLLPAGTARAATGASVYVVHGIPGTDLNLPNDLPVDVSVDGTCAIAGLKFKDVVGPVSLSAGAHDIKISLASASSSCSNAPVITATANVTDGQNASIVAHLSGSGAPTASVFTNTKAKSNKAKVIAHHVAYAPAVDLVFARMNHSKEIERGFSAITNGSQGTIQLKGTAWNAYFTPAGSYDVTYGPVGLELENSKTYLVYAVGSLAKQTFTLITKVI